MVLTASGDQTARLWDAKTGNPLGSALRHGRMVYDARFSADGRQIVTRAHEGPVYIWSTADARADRSDKSDNDDATLFERACARLGYNKDVARVLARHGFANVTPICGDHPPLKIDRTRLQ